MAAVGLMSLQQLESVQEEEELTHQELNDDHRDMNAQSYIKEPIPPPLNDTCTHATSN